jgi:hypothetical protein
MHMTEGLVLSGYGAFEIYHHSHGHGHGHGHGRRDRSSISIGKATKTAHGRSINQRRLLVFFVCRVEMEMEMD